MYKVEQTTWKDVRNFVNKVNKKLGKLIDEISPDDSFNLHKVHLPYGGLVIKKGIFHLATMDNKIKTLSQNNDDVVFNDLSYSNHGMPLGMLLNKSMEYYIDTGSKTIPIYIARPGAVIGAFTDLYGDDREFPHSLLNVRAGGRNVFLLPNIGNINSHKNLSHAYNIAYDVPENLYNHWNVFRSLSSSTDDEWEAIVLFFGKKWIDYLTSDPKWRKLYITLLEENWMHSFRKRNFLFYEFAVAHIFEKNKMRLDSYLLSTVIHLLRLSLGILPGFSISTDESVAPIRLIQEAYIKGYGLRNYLPLIMEPNHFDPNNLVEKAVYYSLHLPTFLGQAPPNYKTSNFFQYLGDLKHLLDDVMRKNSNSALWYHQGLIDSFDKAHFEYFHSNCDKNRQIYSTKQLPQTDPDFMKYVHPMAEGEFPYYSPFLRACVRITQKVG